MNPKAYNEVYDRMHKHAWELYKSIDDEWEREFMSMNILSRIKVLRKERMKTDAVIKLTGIVYDATERMAFTNYTAEQRNHFYWIARQGVWAMKAIIAGFHGKSLCPHIEYADKPIEPFKD